MAVPVMIAGALGLIALVLSLIDVLTLRKAFLEFPSPETVEGLDDFTKKRYRLVRKLIRSGSHKMLWSYVLRLVFLGAATYATVVAGWLGIICFGVLSVSSFYLVKTNLEGVVVLYKKIKNIDTTKAGVLLSVLGFY